MDHGLLAKAAWYGLSYECSTGLLSPAANNYIRLTFDVPVDARPAMVYQTEYHVDYLSGVIKDFHVGSVFADPIVGATTNLPTGPAKFVAGSNTQQSNPSQAIMKADTGLLPMTGGFETGFPIAIKIGQPRVISSQYFIHPGGGFGLNIQMPTIPAGLALRAKVNLWWIELDTPMITEILS